MPIQEVQQANKQHAVPQNIMDVEFKLIGDLTMRQFSYLLIFGVLAYFSAATVGGIFKWPLTIFFAGFGLAFAFVPIAERGLDEWIINFIKAIYSPIQRVWKKSTFVPTAFSYQSVDVVREEMVALAPTSSRRRLEEYLEYQQSKKAVDPLDIPEGAYVLKVREAFAGYTPQAPVPPGVGVSVVVEEPVPATLPQAPVKKPAPVPTQTPTSSATSMPVPAPSPVAKIPAGVQPAPKPKEVPVETPTQVKPTIPRPMVSYPVEENIVVEQITPDRHSGRIFTSFLPSQGVLVLPIRGERVLKTSEEKKSAADIREKRLELEKLIDQIKRAEGLVTPVQKPIQDKPVEEGDAIAKEAQDVVAKLKEENERISYQIGNLKKDLSVSQADTGARAEKQLLLEKLEEQKSRSASDYAALQKQIIDLQNKIKQQSAERQTFVSTPAQATYAPTAQIVNKPNIISGFVKDPLGGPVENLVLLIKDSRGEAVRALKTNSLGQFSLSAPLPQGNYTVEVSSSNYTGFTFDIISVEVKGGIIPPLLIQGK